jgi:hypothetical protein
MLTSFLFLLMLFSQQRLISIIRKTKIWCSKIVECSILVQSNNIKWLPLDSIPFQSNSNLCVYQVVKSPDFIEHETDTEGSDEADELSGTQGRAGEGMSDNEVALPIRAATKPSKSKAVRSTPTKKGQQAAKKKKSKDALAWRRFFSNKKEKSESEEDCSDPRPVSRPFYGSYKLSKKDMRRKLKSSQLHTYLLNMRFFIKNEAEKSSPRTTHLGLLPINKLMKLIFRDTQFSAQVSQAERKLPYSLVPSLTLETFISMSSRDQNGHYKLNEALATVKQPNIIRKADDYSYLENSIAGKVYAMHQAEPPRVVDSSSSWSSGINSFYRPASLVNRVENNSEEKQISAEEEAEEAAAAPAVPFQAADEPLDFHCESESKKSQLTVTLRDYQVQTLAFLMEQEAAGRCTNSYLWTRLQFSTLQHPAKKASGLTQALSTFQNLTARLLNGSGASEQISNGNATGANIQLSFYYSPFLQRFRFKPLPETQGGWNCQGKS